MALFASTLPSTSLLSELYASYEDSSVWWIATGHGGIIGAIALLQGQRGHNTCMGSRSPNLGSEPDEKGARRQPHPGLKGSIGWELLSRVTPGPLHEGAQ